MSEIATLALAVYLPCDFELFSFKHHALSSNTQGAVMVEWLSALLAEQEVRESVPGLAT